MNKKRFINIQSVFSIKDNLTEEKYKYRHGVLDDRLVSLLNELSDENEQLKKENELLKQDLEHCANQFTNDGKNVLLGLK